MTDPALRLLRPALAREAPAVALDESQAAVVRKVVDGVPAVLALGAPGSGKTTVALESVVSAVEAGTDPDRVLVLAASRRGAADLRDRLAARLRRTAGRGLVQTPAAAAFAVLRARAGLLGEPAPTLVSGAEQDLLLGDLLAGHAEGEGVRIDWPPQVPPEALGVRAFRDELRDLLMRAAERGLSPVDLAELGARHGQPQWGAAARLYEEYLDVLQLRSGTPDLGVRYDPAVVVDEASQALLAWDDEVPRAARPRWDLVVVDDYQESTSATARLLRVLADDGARLLLLADPDVAVQTFRGASPALVGRAAVVGDGEGELGARVICLDAVWRHGAAVREVVARITERVGTVGAVRHRRAATHDETGGSVRAAVLPSAAQEAAFVARALRSAYLQDAVDWSDMAVVARSGAQVTAMRRALASAAVPVSVLGSDVPLRDEPAVRPLLLAMAVAVGSRSLDAAVATQLACSPLGGLDAVALRRVRRALRAEELAGGGGRSSDALLVEALGGRDRAITLASSVARPVHRLADVLASAREAAEAPGADAQRVLWALWAASGLAEPWRRSALAGGAAGERADRDLDAVLALFRAAETFVDRMPRATPAAFVDWLQAQDLPSDSIAARARRADVQVLTPAGAAGREWQVVVVAGVQEGTWPDLRLRDSMLGSQVLADVVAGRAPAPGADAAERAAQARQAVLSDELRSFATACSRARSRLLVTAVADADSQPSPFLDLVHAVDDETDDPRRTSVGSPLDLRGLVARLRSTVEAAAERGDDPDPDAVATLARLAAAGVDGADPSTWQGLAEPSSDEPLWGPDERVPVSPSRIETAQRCTLRWALEAAGGTAADTGHQTLGTLVHAIAQEHPDGTYDELVAALDARWGELGLGTGWPARATRAKAEAMVRRLAGYLAGAGEALLVEGGFELATDRALVRGTADRIESAGPGAVRVVDLKTGASPPSVAKAAENPQLAAYQLAVDEGAFAELPEGVRSAEAALVFLGTGSSATLRTQPGLEREVDGPGWARTLVDAVAGSMAASTFVATANDLCDRCPVRRSCPVRGEGAQVVA
ncbi:ATP-dependent helicase [Cellulomonas edaphi]|uniref:DNA 3'-5' helicase n=1 Tax=Cellulomonas edaphi TaxID=3053468 RepID=A0ABT7S8D1_9CELL|nr:PD-(D/E)XK nuclease family protein [Cellulomons edaphi]MDM7831888.1 PD-(D/E)XK nuclease family protein [Cellulomons edaphi]